jgi:hypothetical protein
MLGICKVNKEDVRIHDKVNQILNEDFTKSTNYVCSMRDWLTAYCKEEATRHDICKGKKHKKERVDIHPYMNENHINYVPHIFID